MKSGNDQSANGAARERKLIVSEEEMHQFVVPLTIVHAYVQFLRRRIRQDRMSGVDDLDHALTHMEEATRSMSAQLRAIMGDTSQFRGDADSD